MEHRVKRDPEPMIRMSHAGSTHCRKVPSYELDHVSPLSRPHNTALSGEGAPCAARRPRPLQRVVLQPAAPGNYGLTSLVIAALSVFLAHRNWNAPHAPAARPRQSFRGNRWRDACHQIPALQAARHAITTASSP
jgi:hypothetical protein